MDVCPDYEDLLSVLNANQVKYLVVGGQAVIFHSQPRFTKDMDVWLPPELNDGETVYKALKEFGAPLQNISPEDFSNKSLIIQIGVNPVRIDLMVSVPGVNYDEAWKNRVESRYGKTKIYFLGLNELIQSKRAANRKRDKNDVENLLKTHAKKTKKK